MVDDGSTDHTVEILRRYQDLICVLRQPHLGLPLACSLGLSRARGRYFARLDSDDFAEPSWLRLELKELELHPDACCVSSDYVEVREDGSRIHRPIQPGNLYTRMACGTLFRTQAVRSAGGFRPFYWEEYDLYLRLAPMGRFLHLNQPLYSYRSHPTSMTADLQRRREGWRELAQQWGASFLRTAGTHPELEEALTESTA